MFDKLIEKFGTVLVVVDQPANIGALPLTVARDCGCQVAYLPGSAMRRAAEMYEGEAKTDARDAFVIADVARTNPRTVRQITVADQPQAELTMLVGFDDDLAGESTRTSNRLRGLLAQIHPSLERVLGPRIQHPAALELLARFGSPEQLRRAGTRQIAKVLNPKAPRMAERLEADALHDPASRAYYDRHRNNGKTHTQALLRLARRRIHRPARHAPQRLLLRTAPRHRLTKDIGAPPG